MANDLRRYIVTEIVHIQGVELICLDCVSSALGPSHTLVVASWEHNAGPLAEIVAAATEHESRHHR